MLSLPIAAVLSALTGAVLELGVRFVTGQDEAWDSELFWTTGMPAALVASFGIGLLAKGRAWLGTIAVAPGQFAAMTISLGEVGSLWPLGLVLTAFLSAPFVGASFLGWKLRSAVRKVKTPATP